MSIQFDTVTATEVGAKIIHDFGDDMAIVEYANGVMVIADVEDFAQFGDFNKVGNAVKFKNDMDRNARIAVMIAKYNA